MKTNKKGIDIIKKNEGLELNAYLCPANVWTIGYGHTAGVKQGDKITKEKAEETLVKDLAIFELGVSKLVKVPINENQFSALVSFAFNLGLTALANSTLLKKLNAKDYGAAANEFSKWNKATVKGVKQVLAGLVTRRAEERDLFLEEV